MLSRQAIHRLKPTFISRVGARVASTQAGSSNQSSSSKKNDTKEALAYAGALLGLVAAGATSALLEAPPPDRLTLSSKTSTLKPHKRDALRPEDPNTPPPRPDLPTIPLEEIAEHNDEDSMWYTFRGAVYDLTFFIYGHPGGTPVSIYVVFLTWVLLLC